MITYLLLLGILLCTLSTLALVWRNSKDTAQLNFSELQQQVARLEQVLKEEMRTNREESNKVAADNRQELNVAFQYLKSELLKSFATLTQTLENKLTELTEKGERSALANKDHMAKTILTFQEAFDKNVQSFNELQREKFAQLEIKQNRLVDSTEKKLEQMRETVDEKLQKTLNERLSQSFEQVGKQLESVQKGLGEMQTLAQDVGGLKRVLSNVKMRGGVGEAQLSMLLDAVLAPEQYEANVKTKASSNDIVEFAIKLPGNDEENSQVWLPIDAKFPKVAYEQLQDAVDTGDAVAMEQAQKNLDTTIRKMAKDIHDKYLDPPHTTDFGIMFLPFEGIYAEVVRKSGLVEQLQREYKVIVTGPTTLAAILNSLQMGFKTLAIQKHSSEIRHVLGAVKKEFNSFGGLLGKVQKNFQTGMNQLDEVLGVRTRAITRKLKNVEMLTEVESAKVFPELNGGVNGAGDANYSGEFEPDNE